MTADQWQRVKELFDAALAQPLAARSLWLWQVCPDAEIRHEVESLLASYDQAGEFIQQPLAGIDVADLAPDSRRGQVLGAWRLLEEIGRGGMGTVWRAERADGAFEKEVALKIVSRGMDTDLILRRFHQERQILASLNHPNITALLDGGTSTDGLPYFVMELVEGSPITTFCRERVLPLRARLELFCTVCDGVEYAHRNHVLHRDLKPSNILVTAGGVPKLLDFGIAKLLTALPGAETTLAMGPLQMLTPEYASPEQARGEPVSERTDVYSLGVILYELVTDCRPYEFQARSPQEIVSTICEREPATPSVASRQPQLKGDLDSIVMMALHKEPPFRCASVQDLVADVQRFLTAQPVRAVTPTLSYRARKFVQRRSGRMAAAILGTALLGVGAGLAVWLSHPGNQTSAPILTRLTSDAGLATDPAVSPDGKLFAYASDRGGDGNLDIWLQPIGRLDAIRLTAGAGDDHNPSFSPDGSRIAFERDGGGIHVVPAAGGAATMIAPGGQRPRFSPDGKWIAYWTGIAANDFSRHAGSRIYVVPALGGTPIQAQSEFAISRFPVWAPDGKHIVFLGSREPGEIGSGTGSWDWWVSPVGSGPAVRTGAFAVLRERKLGAPVPSAWTAEGRIVFAATVGDSKNIWQIAISPGNWRVAGLPEQLTSGAGSADLPAAAPGGRIAFANPAENIDIWSLPIDHGRAVARGEPRRLTENASMDAQPAISADGRRMAFVTFRAGNSDVWLKDLRTGEESPIATLPVNESSPAISDDGSHLAYTQSSRNKREILVAFIDGRSRPGASVCDDCFLAWAWSPDNKSLLYWSLDQHQIGLLDVASRQKTLVLRHPIHPLLRSHFSPDGHWIAFVMLAPPDRSQLFVAPFQGMSVIGQDKWVAVANGKVARWSPDGNSLYFVSALDGSWCVWRQSLEPVSKQPVGEPAAVYHSHGARRSISGVPVPYLEMSVARDKIVFPMKESTGNIWMAEWIR